MEECRDVDVSNVLRNDMMRVVIYDGDAEMKCVRCSASGVATFAIEEKRPNTGSFMEGFYWPVCNICAEGKCFSEAPYFEELKKHMPFTVECLYGILRHYVWRSTYVHAYYVDEDWDRFFKVVDRIEESLSAEAEEHLLSIARADLKTFEGKNMPQENWGVRCQKWIAKLEEWLHDRISIIKPVKRQ